jgi:hypothetical protein
MTHDDLRVLCREWQERLRLVEWQVELHHIPLHDDWGTVVSNLEKKQAHIYIRDQAYAAKETENRHSPFGPEEEFFFHEDEEVVLVHELLHLMFKPFDLTKEDSLEDKCLEFACTSLSHALVGLKRKAEANG